MSRGAGASRLGAAVIAVGAAILCARPVAAQETAVFFRQNCASCHTIGGGRLVGPDLKDVTGRKERDWLLRFIGNPKSVLDSGDPYALRLREEARGAVMPPIAGMNPDRAQALLGLIEAESKLPKSQFIGLSITDEPFKPEDIRRGLDLFTGRRRLANGGAPCLSCHTVAGLGGLSGGQLGPDLTKVYERMQGRKNLAAWLQAPATPTMQPVFSVRPLVNEEILPLVAWLENETRTGGAPEASPRVAFLLLGLGGAIAGFVLADVVWRGRFRAVRRPLVKGRA
jgi:mono/diheme cytochrome c family protein